MIIPNPWLTNLLQQDTRRFVTQNTRIREIVHFLFPVFSSATVDTEIVLLEKATPYKNVVQVTIVLPCACLPWRISSFVFVSGESVLSRSLSPQ
jgi:hypothetical protein